MEKKDEAKENYIETKKIFTELLEGSPCRKCANLGEVDVELRDGVEHRLHLQDRPTGQEVEWNSSIP